jgi:hypothetical protein
MIRWLDARITALRRGGDTGQRTWTTRRDFVGEIVVRERPDIIGLQ